MKCQLFVFLIAMAAWAQTPDATFRVAGFLTNSVTGEPVRRATVEIKYLSGLRPAPGLRTATADAGGHFEFNGVEPGSYRLWAGRRGYERQSLAPSAGLTVTEDRADLLFKMEPFAALTGKVVDENEDPIPGAAIQLIRSVIESGRRELRPAVSVVTDDRGEYRVASLPSGRYFVSADARSQEASENTAYGRRFFPGAPDLRTAAPLELQPGGHQQADFQLVPEAVFHVRGRVAGNERLTNVSVALAPRNTAEQFGGAGYPSRYLGEGRFEVSGVPPGQYTLTISAYEGGRLQRGSQAIAVGSADLEGLAITPQPGSPVTGRATVEQRGGIPPLELRRVAIQLLPEDSIRDAGIDVRLEADRLSSKTPAAPGNYSLRVNVPEPYYAKLATVGGLDALAGPVTVTESGDLAPVELVIGSNGGEVSGKVKLQDEPAVECLVMLIRTGSATPSQDKLAQTDQRGKFIMSAVAPGEYTVYAWRDISTVEFRNPQALTQFSGEVVRVAEGGKQTVDLKLNVN